MLSLPEAKYYEYFSRTFHQKKFINLDDFIFSPLESEYDYPTYDKERFTYFFLTDNSYINDKSILDLGCHIGYMSFISSKLGAKNVHGVNARQYPLDVANFCFTQLKENNFNFTNESIENFEFLKKTCATADTVILTEVLEHCRNPVEIINIISNSHVKYLIFDSTLTSDSGPPELTYRIEKTNTNYTAAYENGKENTLACVPNMSWITSVLYHFDWKIEHVKTFTAFNKNHFAVPDLAIPPKLMKKIYLLAKKFDRNIDTCGGWKT